MGKFNADKLPSALKQAFKPVYLVSGDETLLVHESCMAIRKHAKEQGFSQHEIYHAEGQFDWDSILMSANALSLFAERKIIELRVPNGKLGDKGSKVIKAYCESPPEDTLLIIVLPKIDKRSESSAWYKSVSSVGDCVTIWPIGLQQLPRWVEKRLYQAGLSAEPEALAILCAKIEGNLLAAVQEIEKLKLMGHDKVIDAAAMAASVMDSSRFNAFDLIDKALSGDTRASVECLSSLRSEGTSAPVLLWALTNQVRSLAEIKDMTDKGRSFENAATQARVWKSKMPLVKRAHQRLHTQQLLSILRKCALTDKMIKGVAMGDEWNELLDITLRLTGVDALNKRSQNLALKSVKAY